MNANRSVNDIFRLEHEVVTQYCISEERFRKVSGRQWENIYQKIIEKYADKTKSELTRLVLKGEIISRHTNPDGHLQFGMAGVL